MQVVEVAQIELGSHETPTRDPASAPARFAPEAEQLELPAASLNSPTSSPVLSSFKQSRSKRHVEERLARFRNIHGSQAETFQRESADFAARLDAGSFGAKRSYVLHPEKTKILRWWDLITSIALIYTATLTPLETAFVPPVMGPSAWRDPWFVINRCLDVVFFLDLLLQFFICYQTGNAYAGRMWVEDHRRIVVHYLSSWFALDAFTVFLPGSFDLYLASPELEVVAGAPDDGAGAAGQVGVLRVLRALRLIKLVRLLRASRVFERWKAKITLSYGTQTVIQLVMTVLFCSHWYACIIALQASLHASIHDTLAGEELYGLCRRNDQMSSSAPEQYLEGCSGLDLGTWYLAAYSWSVLIITGTGGTDFYPSNQSAGETGVVTILSLAGAFLWTYVLALFLDIVTNANPALTAFRQKLDGLNLFIQINELNPEIAERLRIYMHQQKAVVLRQDAQSALPYLSLPLQVEVVMQVHQHWLGTIWFVKPLEGSAKVRLANCMKPKVFAPCEVAANRRLFVIARGTIVYGGRLLTRHMAWGDDVILTDKRWFLQITARAVTFADVMCFGRDQLMEIMQDHPESAASLRRSTILLALRRALVIISRQLKRRSSLPVGMPVSPDVLEMRRQKQLPDSVGGNLRGRIFEAINDALEGRLTGTQRAAMMIAANLNTTSLDDRPAWLEDPESGPSSAESSASALQGDFTASVLVALERLGEKVDALQKGQDELHQRTGTRGLAT